MVNPDQTESSAHKVDWVEAAAALSRVANLVSGNTIAEADLPDFSQMSQEEARTFCEALSGAADAVLGNTSKP